MAPPAQARTPPLAPRWLVTAVVVMGLLIVVGSVIVGTEVTRRLSSPKPAAPPAAPAPAPSDAAFRQKIELPPGSQVISMNPVGDRLVVHVESQAGLASAYIVDPRTGALLGTIDFPSGAPR